MSKVVVDIETVGFDFEKFPQKDQEYLLKYAVTEEQREEIKKKTGLYPLTGEVVTIWMLNPESEKGMVLFQSKDKKIEKFEEDGIVYESGDEKEILEKFWKYIANFSTIITFNGRGFDAPYLLLRSAIHRVRATKNLMGYRYDARVHCDLMEQLTFYGAVRKYNLDFCAKAFGIKSSKEEGIDGSMVSDLYKEGRYLDVARYCHRDLMTTKELYLNWEKYLKFD